MAKITNEKWAPVVGRFMIAFGSIESSVNELLRHQCSEAQMRLVLQLMLSQRFKLLREMLVERNLSDGARKILLANLNDANELTKTRNLIAHNPLVLARFDAGNPRTRTTREVIRAEHNGKAIEFDELSQLTADAIKVARALEQNWIELDIAEMGAREPLLKRR